MIELLSSSVFHPMVAVESVKAKMLILNIAGLVVSGANVEIVNGSELSPIFPLSSTAIIL